MPPPPIFSVAVGLSLFLDTAEGNAGKRYLCGIAIPKYGTNMFGVLDVIITVCGLVQYNICNISPYLGISISLTNSLRSCPFPPAVLPLLSSSCGADLTCMASLSS